MFNGATPSRRGVLTLGVSALAVSGLAACRTKRTPAEAISSSAAPVDPRFPGDPGTERSYLGVSRAVAQPADSGRWLNGTRISMSRRYYQADQIALMLDDITADHRDGVVPFVSIKPDLSWAEVADENDDGWLEAVLSSLQVVTAPVFLAIHHEPENDHDTDNKPADWVAMQRRAFKLVRRKSDLVTVVPVLMSWTFNPESGRVPRDWVVPHCRLMGFDFYNQWAPDLLAPWTELLELVGQVREVIGPNVPIIAPELGCRNDPDDPERASRWMSAAFDDAHWLGVVGLAWFNSEYAEDIEFRLDAAERATLAGLLDRPEVARITD
ncbi:hypothetical protein [Nocardioides sp.]|uniref:hypothetical protein n=1 Tax=Nocardioides sp. TaxID=35761 RepID=UPI003D09FBDD